MLTLLILAWALEVPATRSPRGWCKTPWKMVGALLFGKLNQTFPVEPLVMSGFDLLVLLMFGVLAYRHHQRSMMDRSGLGGCAGPIRTFAWLSLVAVAWMCLWGVLHGGSAAVHVLAGHFAGSTCPSSTR